MRTGIVAFLIGNTCLLYWPYLPDIYYILLLSGLFLILTGILYKARQYFVSLPSITWNLCILLLCFLSGIIYTSLYINQQLPALDLEQFEGETITVKGFIDSIPFKTEKKQGFEFFILSREKIDKSGNISWDQSFTGKVRLSWYSSEQALENGQTWQMDIRLKKPNGLLNDGGFDYEKWLYQNRILATGYVRKGLQLNQNKVLFTQSVWVQFRQKVSSRLDSVLHDHTYKGLIKALTIGVRHDLEAQQWQIFFRTGTNHLIAISGLHIGLMSSLVWFLVNFLWKLNAHLNMRIPAYYVASVTALCSAFLYAALAGFAIPTQRALIMLAVVFSALLLKRELSSAYILLLALLLVLLFDPVSTLSYGFWLSFTAVAVILFSLTARLGTGVESSRQAKIIQLGKMQWVIFIGLLPLMLLLFNQFSLLSPLANLFAVPLMSVVIVPVTLFSVMILFIYEPVAILLFDLLQWPMDFLMLTLDKLSQWPDILYSLPESSWLVLLLAFAGCLWFLMPRGWNGRWMGVFLLLPAFMFEGDEIAEGQIQMTVLDVGQGLSVILRTQNHNLIYDTGDKFSEKFNMGDVAIVPYIRTKGIGRIDKLIVSHSDRDHAGSYSEVLAQLPVEHVMSGEAEWINAKSFSNSGQNSRFQQIRQVHAEQCIQGQQWQWDKVQFNVLSPQWPLKVKKANNHSCVIQVTTASGHTFLLTGDMEKKIEKQLLKRYPTLNSDVLIVPHHGSNTSSSMTFLEQIKPQIAVFSYGYRNRFKHPAEKVVQRYKKLGINLYNTTNGAIDIRSNLTNNSLSVKQYRIENRRFWHREPEHL